MTRKNRALALIAAALVATALFGAFHLLYVKETRRVMTEPSGRAAVDPYYALELVLEAYGFEVRASSGRLDDLRRADLVFWLAKEPPGDEVWDAFAEGATVVIADAHFGAFFAEDEPSLPSLESELPAGLRFFVSDDAEGEVATLPDVAVLTSARLREAGHAEVVAELVHPLPPDAVVVIVRHVAGMNLLQIVLGPGLPAVVALLALLALLARRSALRVGPMLSAPARGRRSFLEHLMAVGHFARRHGGEDALVASARAEVLARFVRRRPELAGLSGDALVEALREHVALDRETLERALVRSPRGHPRAFVDFVNALQELRKSP